jgi:glycosyltransferase involved in cell wall biosynthesis
MKIAFITPEYVTEKSFDGGLANYLFKISSALVEKEHKVFVIVCSDKSERIVRDNIVIIRVNTDSVFLKVWRRLLRGRLYRPLNWLLQSWELNKSLKRLHYAEGIDIAQFASYTGTAFFRPSFIPSVSRISSYQPLWDEAYNIKSSLGSFFCNKIELYALKKSSEIYGPSKLIAKIIENKLSRKIKIIETPLFVNKDINTELYVNKLLGKKYLLFFGSLGELKGCKEIADILYELFNEYPNLYFVFAGKDLGYQGRPMIDYIYDKAGKYAKNCIYLGSIKQDKLKPIIDNSEAVVLPSRVDNFPNACIESMANGKIVLGTRGASFEQLIEHKHSGFLCEIKNSKSLHTVIKSILILNLEERNAIEAAAIKRIEELNPTLIIGQLENFYKIIIDKYKK